MNRLPRLFSGLFLAAVIALSSVTMALARHQAAGGETVIICTADGLKAITLDDNGNPTGPVHLCPLCIAAGDLPPAVAPVQRGESYLVAVLPRPAGAFAGFSRAFCDLRARAPPVSLFA